MRLSRREFFTPVASGDMNGLRALVGARGAEAFGAASAAEPDAGPIVRLDSNENPLGPGRAAIDALTREFSQVMRYPINSRKADADLREQLAAVHGTRPENIVLGAGSSEILRNAVRAFTSPTAHLVSVTPTFTACEDKCRAIGHPVKLVGLDRSMRIDLDATVSAAARAGLVFFCNPNNPTATVHPARAVADLAEKVRTTSPGTVLLIDEAYHDYVTWPEYATAVPLALAQPGVVVSRTFSKAYGIAGLRLGYAVGHADTIKALARFRLPNGGSVLAVAAALASVADPAHIAEERERNRAVRAFTVDFFIKAGFTPAESQANFVFVPIGRPAKTFREACAREHIQVGRDFPPLQLTHARVSLGTMDEMRRATDVFARILSAPTSSASRG